MSDSTTPVATPARGKGLAARAWGILTSPRETFADVVANPRWFGMMTLVILVTIGCMAGFLSRGIASSPWRQ